MKKSLILLGILFLWNFSYSQSYWNHENKKLLNLHNKTLSAYSIEDSTLKLDWQLSEASLKIGYFNLEELSKGEETHATSGTPFQKYECVLGFPIKSNYPVNHEKIVWDDGKPSIKHYQTIEVVNYFWVTIFMVFLIIKISLLVTFNKKIKWTADQLGGIIIFSLIAFLSCFFMDISGEFWISLLIGVFGGAISGIVTIIPITWLLKQFQVIDRHFLED